MSHDFLLFEVCIGYILIKVLSLCSAVSFSLYREEKSQHPGQSEQHKWDHNRRHLLHRAHPPHRLCHCPDQAAT